MQQAPFFHSLPLLLSFFFLFLFKHFSFFNFYHLCLFLHLFSCSEFMSRAGNSCGGKHNVFQIVLPSLSRELDMLGKPEGISSNLA